MYSHYPILMVLSFFSAVLGILVFGCLLKIPLVLCSVNCSVDLYIILGVNMIWSYCCSYYGDVTRLWFYLIYGNELFCNFEL